MKLPLQRPGSGLRTQRSSSSSGQDTGFNVRGLLGTVDVLAKKVEWVVEEGGVRRRRRRVENESREAATRRMVRDGRKREKACCGEGAGAEAVGMDS